MGRVCRHLVVSEATWHHSRQHYVAIKAADTKRLKELEQLTADLPRLWEAETTSNKDRKQLLRKVIADVTLLPEPDHAKARIGIRWHTGA